VVSLTISVALVAFDLYAVHEQHSSLAGLLDWDNGDIIVVGTAGIAIILAALRIFIDAWWRRRTR
jgi:hypothetical protein